MATEYLNGDLLAEDPDGVLPEPGTAASEAPALTQAGRRRMRRQREEISNQVVGAVKEIESLRQRQEQLEKERGDLEDLGRRQEQYETAKRDILDKLGRSLSLMEKDEMQATRMVELLAVIREKFKDAQAELQAINEAAWPDERFRDELNRAGVVVEDARAVYRKGMARIEAESWQKTADGKLAPAVVRGSERINDWPRRFGFWFKVGLAFSLPLLIVLAVLLAVTAALHRLGWW